MPLTLLSQHDPLSDINKQLIIINEKSGIVSFDEELGKSGLFPLSATGVEVFQVNLGKRRIGERRVEVAESRIEQLDLGKPICVKIHKPGFAVVEL